VWRSREAILTENELFTEIEEARAFAQAIIDTVREPFLVLDNDLRVLAASRSFYQTFKVSHDDTQGRLLYALGDGQWDIPGLRLLLEKIVPERGEMADYEVEHEFPDIGQRTMLLNARKVFYEKGSHTTILLGIEDITAQRVLEREKDELLRQFEEARAFAQAIVDTVREPFLVLDQDLRVLAASRSFCETFKVSHDDTQGRLLYALGDGQWDIPKLHLLLEKIVPEQGVMENYEVEHEFPDIGQRTMCLNARKVFYEGGSHTTILLGIEDITAQRVLEREKDELSRQKDELLGQKVILAKEFDHRLMNSLQLISSLLSLQSRTTKNPEAAAQLSIAGNRVAALGRVHRRLHVLDHLETVEFKQYASRLCEDLSGMLHQEETKRSIVVEGEDIEIPTLLGIPLGFIVNELVTNSTKYAKGKITVRLETIPESYSLSVFDDGPGLPEGFTCSGHKGLGMKIIQSLVKQIGGELQFGRGDGDRGARFTVLFSITPQSQPLVNGARIPAGNGAGIVAASSIEQPIHVAG
jgi:chemotaxis protein methyltransferase CheR